MPGLCVSIASEIWSPIVNTGFSDVIGSWKIIAISPPRIVAELLLRQRQEISLPVARLAANDTTGRLRDQPEHRHHRDALPRAGLADDAERLAGEEVVGDVGDGVDDPVLRLELDRQLVDGEDGIRHGLAAAGRARRAGRRR